MTILYQFVCDLCDKGVGGLVDVRERRPPAGWGRVLTTTAGDDFERRRELCSSCVAILEDWFQEWRHLAAAGGATADNFEVESGRLRRELDRDATAADSARDRWTERAGVLLDFDAAPPNWRRYATFLEASCLQLSYDLDEHPEGYNGPCACADCRSSSDG